MKSRYQTAIDVDDTVFPMRETLAKYIRERFGLPLEFEAAFLNSQHWRMDGFLDSDKRFVIPNWQDIWKDVFRSYGDSEYFLAQPYEGTDIFTDNIYATGGIVHVLTRRGSDENPNYIYKPGPDGDKKNILERKIGFLNFKFQRGEEFSLNETLLLVALLTGGAKIRDVYFEKLPFVQKVIFLANLERTRAESA